MSKEALQTDPVQRQLIQKRRATSSPEAQIDRVLLPDAPPIKLRTQRLSPERQACHFVGSRATESAQLSEPVAEMKPVLWNFKLAEPTSSPEAQIDRVLLPDAPPIKLRTQRPSPERQACHFVGSRTTESAQLSEPVAEMKPVLWNFKLAEPTSSVQSTELLPQPPRAISSFKIKFEPDEEFIDFEPDMESSEFRPKAEIADPVPKVTEPTSSVESTEPVPPPIRAISSFRIKFEPDEESFDFEPDMESSEFCVKAEIADPVPKVTEPTSSVESTEPIPQPIRASSSFKIKFEPVEECIQFKPDMKSFEFRPKAERDVADEFELDKESSEFHPIAEREVADGYQDSNIARVIDYWLDADSYDEDLSVDFDNVIPLSDVNPLSIVSRDAASQPANDSNINAAQAAMLRQEEEASDRHLHEIVPSEDYLEFNWTNDRANFLGKREQFTGVSGPTFPTTGLTIVDIFFKMIDVDFIDFMVTQTNLYAEQILTKKRADPTTCKYARALRWTPTNRDEMVSFLAVMILQGLYPKAKEETYFSFDGYGTTPYFKCIMTYNRYSLLKRFHHFVDNDASTNMTKLSKINPVIDYFNNKFTSLYYPDQEVVINKSLLNLYGLLSFSQKIKPRRADVVKTYELSESSTGYLWKFFVYSGKDGHNRPPIKPEQTDGLDRQTIKQVEKTDDNPFNRQDGRTADSAIDGVRPTNASSKIVFDLIEPLLNKGHTLITDIFFNSPLLARCLKQQKTDVFGTLRLTREFFPEALKTLTKTGMREGEVVASYCSDLAVMVWRDANLISMISTFHPLEIGIHNEYNKFTYKPAIVLDYNKTMGGVDRKEQFLSAQPLERSLSQVWYKKLFRRLFNDALFNCFIIYTSRGKRIDHRRFRTVLAEDLLKIYRKLDLTTECRLRLSSQTKTIDRPTPSFLITGQDRPYVESNHFPVRSSSRATRCIMCKARTSKKCEECDVSLCIISCFKNYHKPKSRPS